jgi:hypothetical protein
MNLDDPVSTETTRVRSKRANKRDKGAFLPGGVSARRLKPT